MSVFLRGKYFAYDFVLNGERYRGSTKQTNKKDALIFESQEKEKARKGLLGNNQKTIKLIDGYETFLKVPRKKKPGKQREKAYRNHFDDFIAFMTDKYPKIAEMNQVTSNQAEEYIYKLQKNGKYNKTTNYKRGNATVVRKKCSEHIANSTVNDYIMLLKMVFTNLKKRANIQENPFADIPLLARDTEHREAFTPEELKLIGEKSKNTYLYPLFLTGICTGLREGDICTLKCEEVNLKTNWITRKQRKTGNTVTIPIMPPLKAYLLTLPMKGDYVFPDLADRYETTSEAIGRDVTKLLESIGIESTREVPGRSRKVSVRDIHSLRHTFAYTSAIAGIPLPVVQSVLGHMDSKMTQMYMNHASGEAKQKYLAALPDYLNTGNGAASVTNEYLIERLDNMNADNWKEIRDNLKTCITTQIIQ
jgi:integrase